MAKFNRFFRREFLAKPDDESDSTAVTARVSNNSDAEGGSWLSAHLMLSRLGDWDDARFSMSFFGDSPDELKNAMRQVDTLKKVINDFADAMSAEIEALSSKE